MLSRNHAILPPGFALESEATFTVLVRRSELLSSGAIVLAAREENLLDLLEKKRQAYAGARSDFPSLYLDSTVRALAAAEPVLIPRRTRVGAQASRRWSETANHLYPQAFDQLPGDVVDTILGEPARLVSDGEALTWAALLPRLPQAAAPAHAGIRTGLQHNYLALYEREYSTVSLSELPGIPLFGLDSHGSAYSFLRLSEALRQTSREDLLVSTSEQFLARLDEPGLDALLDVVVSSAEVWPTARQLGVAIRRARAEIKMGPVGPVTDESLYVLAEHLTNRALREAPEMAGILQRAGVGEALDAVIITANRRESLAVRQEWGSRYACDWSESYDSGLPRWTTRVSSKGVPLSAALIQADETGAAEAVDALYRALSVLRPQVVMFVGCAMLLDERTAMVGDSVYFARRALDGSKGSVSDEGIQFDLDSSAGHVGLRRIAEMVAQSQDIAPIRLITNRDFVSVPWFFEGRASQLRKELVRALPRDTVVGEMEAYSVLKVMERFMQDESRARVPVGVIKGISDVGDEHAQDAKEESQGSASRNAARVALEILIRMHTNQVR